jgi:hypothetical protein
MESREAIPESPEAVVLPFTGDDPAHYKELRDFLEREASDFHATADIENLIHAIRKNQIQVLLLTVAGETIGCATQYPTAIPQWDREQGKFYFIPAVHSEDMSVIRKGMGTLFMRQRITLAANEGKNCGFDLRGKVRAGALVGEQRWHDTAHGEGTAIGGLLAKFSTEMARDKSDTVLRLDASIFPKVTAVRDIEILSLGDPESDKGSCSHGRPDIFAVTWGAKGGEKIAAAFTLGMSTFTGHQVVRVHIKSNGNLGNDSELNSAIANLLTEGRAEILDRGWIEKTVDPLNRMYIHALGENELRRSLKEAGAQDRLVGDCLMYPLVMKFADIPSAMAMDLRSAAPFVPLGRRSSAAH